MTPTAARKALARLDRQALFTAQNLCHPKQAALVEAIVSRRYRRICVRAGRQSGKSHGVGAIAAPLLAMANPGTNQIYVTATSESCQKMAFDPAAALAESYQLDCRPYYNNHSIKYTNGSNIYYLGADNPKTIARLRGTPNLIACHLDESGIYKSDTLKAMYQAVSPGLRPRAGLFNAMGTPSLDGPHGFWYDITQSDKYEQFYFDYRDNDRVPNFADADRLIDEDLAAQGFTRDSAYFKREYLAEFAIDLSERVYQFDDTRNVYQELPGNLTSFLVCGDTGVKDADALGVIGWSATDPTIYLVKEFIKRGQDVDDLAQILVQLWAEYKPIKIVLDAGANLKSILTLQNRYRDIPIEAAIKPAINQQIAETNNFLRQGLFKVSKTSRFAKEVRLPVWIDGKVGGKVNEDGPRKSDIVPGIRYGLIAARPFLPDKGTVLTPKPPSDKAVDLTEQQLDQLLADQIQNEKSAVAILADGCNWADANGDGYLPN